MSDSARSFRERLFLAHQRYERLVGFRDVSNTELARLLGLSQPSVSAWFQGARPKDDTMDAIAQLYGVRYEWLARGRGEMVEGQGTPIIVAKKPFRAVGVALETGWEAKPPVSRQRARRVAGGEPDIRKAAPSGGAPSRRKPPRP